MMQRELIVRELQKRLNDITVANGYPLTVSYIFRNPDDEPSPDTMPCVNIFEMEDTSMDFRNRGGSFPPIITKNFRVALEAWLVSTSEGLVSTDVSAFLRSERQVIFSDGVTLGGAVSIATEVEVSRVFRPGIANFVGGIGVVLEFIYIEDFSNL
jgi:hypothetical protein